MPSEGPEDANPSPGWLIRSVQIFAVVTALAGVTLVSASFTMRDWRPGIAGMVLLFAAITAGGIWILHALLDDRSGFYLRGWLAGWYAGWHGKIPNPEGPLLRK